MNIREYAEKYCADIIQRADKQSDLFDVSGFSYDEIIVEEDGTRVPVVNTVNHQIPVQDILTNNRESFAKIWSTQDCLEAYDNYVSTLIILEGEEVLQEIRNEMLRAQERLSLYDNLPKSFL